MTSTLVFGFQNVDFYYNSVVRLHGSVSFFVERLRVNPFGHRLRVSEIKHGSAALLSKNDHDHGGELSYARQSQMSATTL